MLPGIGSDEVGAVVVGTYGNTKLIFDRRDNLWCRNTRNLRETAEWRHVHSLARCSLGRDVRINIFVRYSF